MCLGDGRFSAQVEWLTGAAGAEARALSHDAAHFGAQGGAGLDVRLVDGRADNGFFWVQRHAPAKLAYRLTLVDLQTGETRTYEHAANEPQEADLYALPERLLPETPSTALMDAPESESERCDGGVCLAGRRLRIAARSGGLELPGEAAGDDTAVFRLGHGDPDFVVSVIDARERDGSWWVLSSAPSGAAATIEVTDLDTNLKERITLQGTETALAHLATATGVGVGVVLDPTRAAHAAITDQGGTVHAKSANGVVFTLTIPAKALFSKETITLTPLKSMQRLPFAGGVVAGVQIDPPGLHFSGVARLAIAPPTAVTKAQETTFGYRKAGAQFFLYPAKLAVPGVVLTLTHTGGYGLARGTASEQQAQLKRLPPQPDDQFEQRLWAVHSRLRQGKSLAAEAEVAAQPLSSAAVDAFFRDAYQKSLKAMLTQIAASCAGRKKGGPLAQEFIAQGQADGFSDVNDFKALQAALNQGNAKCYDDAAEACVGGPDSSQAVPLLRAWFQLTAAGATDLVDASKGEACLVFQLVLNSTIDLDLPPVKSRQTVVAKTMVRFKRPFHFGTSGLPNDYHEEAVWTGSSLTDCTTRFTGRYQLENLSVRYLYLNANYYNDEGPLTRMALVYDIGNPMEELNVGAPPCPPETVPGEPGWVQYFRLGYVTLHVLDKLNTDGYNLGPYGINEFIETRWDIRLQDDLFAKKDYARTNGSETELTNLNIFHRPGQ
ncbi:MAG: hypothetical protein ABI609_17880 [Acidobacteriota bacterium]